MPLSVQRFVSMIAVQFTVAVVALFSFSMVALAQESGPFEIRVTPQTDYAVTGQVLTYLVTVTNTSQTPASNVFVKMKIPAGTTFVDTHYTNLKWFGGKPVPGTTVEEVVWFTPEVIASGEVVTFALTVNVLPELAEREVINEGYDVTRMEGNVEKTVATGPTVTTKVLQPTPTSSLVATLTPISTSTVTPAQTNQLGTEVALNTTAPTIPQSSSSVITEVILDAPTTTPEQVLDTSPPLAMLIGVGLVLVGLVIVGLIWFLRRR